MLSTSGLPGNKVLIASDYLIVLIFLLLLFFKNLNRIVSNIGIAKPKNVTIKQYQKNILFS